MSKIVITAALTGPMAKKSDNPGLPVTPEEIAVAAMEAYEAGASVVHVHVRDADGMPTADVNIAREAIERIQAACPVLVQLSTGVGPGVPLEERAKLIELKPQMASLNPCSMSFGNAEFSNPPLGVRRLAARMRELGVKAELEVYDSGHVDVCLQLLKEGLLVEPLQFSIVMGISGGMAATLENLLTTVRRLPANAVWQAIAVGRSNLELTTAAMTQGGNVRTGLEDTLYLSKGVLAPNSAALVARLVAIAKILGREPATLDETRAMLQL
jgi:3-keto-5-aminohexanoate cleavage enzyme